MHESSGLRFDVYERVHLPQDAADIREIEELELTPCVQAERQGEQVVLRGSLLLGGVYLPDDESRNSRQLEHWIPVEITLPLERVDRVEDLAVEVDNFDVDLLDKRTLNITGVLTLKGVKPGTAGSTQQTYAWGEEPYTVVHRRGRDLTRDEASESGGGALQQSEDDEQSFAPLEQYASEETPEPAQAAEWRFAYASDADDAEDRADADAASSALAAEPAEVGLAGETTPGSEPVQADGTAVWQTFAAREREELAAEADNTGYEAEREEGRSSGSGPDAEQGAAAADSGDAAAAGFGSGSAQEEVLSASAARNDAQEDAQPQEALAAAVTSGSAAQAASGRTDLRVAVGAKRDAETSGAEGSTGLGKLFFPERRETRGESGQKAQEASEPSRTGEAADEGNRQAASDEVDWRSLFRGAAAQEAFRKVRLCIVQKDDTLDAIAIRYQRNPREIALANRLDGSPLTEGQVLYIP